MLLAFLDSTRFEFEFSNEQNRYGLISYDQSSNKFWNRYWIGCILTIVINTNFFHDVVRFQNRKEITWAFLTNIDLLAGKGLWAVCYKISELNTNLAVKIE